MPTAKALITEDMLIGDVLNLLPDAAQIMQDFGLHCTSCSVNVFEPLKMGAMSHGIEEEVVDEMILRINELAAAKKRAPDDGIYVTSKAAEKIKDFATAEDKEGWGLKITATLSKEAEVAGQEPVYAMDFQQKALKGDKTFEFHNVSVYIDKKSLPHLLGAEVDFIESAYGSGFKISNLRFKKNAGKACACGGNGACGCSGGEHEEDGAGCKC